jgi:hypothetical protein
MAYSKERKNLQNSEGLTMWLKHKFVKKKDGTEKEVFQGSVDIGGGKMVKIQVDARMYTVDVAVNGNPVACLPVYVSKWKSEAKATSTTTRKSW